MSRRTTLFVINSDTTDDEITTAAENALAEEDHLHCLLVAAAPSLPVYAYGIPPYGALSIPDDWADMAAEARDQLKERIQGVEEMLAQRSVSGEVSLVYCPQADIKHHVAGAALVSDEAVFSATLRNTPEIMREAAYGVLFHSPVGLRLNGQELKNFKRVFVAWDGSHAAASAVHAALLYLKKAEEVVIGCIDPDMSLRLDSQNPGTDLAAWLSHHGCKVTVSQFPAGGLEVGQCIQSRAREVGADLVVLGAYGHSRLVEAVFGGTTRTLMEQIDLPVLLSH